MNLLIVILCLVELLAQCFGAKAKRNDQFEWLINGGSITAIPLNGEKIRGFRANVLVLDEYLLLPEDIISTVLMPFLVAPQNMKERLQIYAGWQSLYKNYKPDAGKHGRRIKRVEMLEKVLKGKTPRKAITGRLNRLKKQRKKMFFYK